SDSALSAAAARRRSPADRQVKRSRHARRQPYDRPKCRAAARRFNTQQLTGRTGPRCLSSHTPQAPLLARWKPGGVVMLYSLAVILLIAWLLGVVGTYTIGAFVHVLLVVAIVLFLIGLLSGRETVV